jgi:DNA mismatch repair protein MutS
MAISNGSGKKIAETPLMKQYFAFKAKYPEALLLFRVGDFYETFGDDAVTASKVLGIVLTKRANGPAQHIDLAGFPHHAIETYLPKLVMAGYKVAVCDQLEDPKFAKGIVKRGVTELVTPGVAYNEQLLPQKENNFLASVAFEKDKGGVAFLDISTGAFKVAEGDLEYIEVLISNFSPREILVEKSFAKGFKDKFPTSAYISSMDEWAFVYESSYEKLRNHFHLDSLKGFGVEHLPLGITAAGAILFYLENNQQAFSDYCPTRGLSQICSISRIDRDDFVWLDRFTIRNLELLQPATKDGVTLLDIIDKCSSNMGGRLLRSWIAMPSRDLVEIGRRHDFVQFLVERQKNGSDSEGGIISSLEQRLSAVGDLERIVSRAAAGRVTPREVMQLRRGLGQILPIRTILGKALSEDKLCEAEAKANGAADAVENGSQEENKCINAVREMMESLDDCAELRKTLGDMLAREPAAQIGKGDVIAGGYNSELDELRNIARHSKEFLLDIQEREQKRTGISSLKISYNNVFGYYLEVRNTHKDKVPQEWIRKQTLVSAERYITPELKDYEEKILGAEEKIFNLESAIYSEIIVSIQKNIPQIQKNAAAIARLDCLVSFASSAIEYGYSKPLMNDGDVLSIKQGRHAVIERLMPEGEKYVANDLYLDRSSVQIIILTGPNMSGKSALLRQTALIVLMAQMGSFVPAEEAHIGYFDKIFTRVGASDNISRGESTFMVEMLETSTILHNLSPRSLVLLDEIGRGTSTFDGMSIAWAIVEFIHEHGYGAKTLFATHYHELNELENKYDRVKNFHISVKEIDGKILFLRKLCEGGVAHSFGIHVARLAGMPKEVILSAEKTLKKLEEESAENTSDRLSKEVLSIRSKGGGRKRSLQEDKAVQLSFFQLDDPILVSIRDTLHKLNIDSISPLDAFDIIRKLKKMCGE